MSRAARALRPLLLVAAVLGLLGTGGVEIAPRQGPAGGSAPVGPVAGPVAGPGAGTGAGTGAVHRADAPAPPTVVRPGQALASTTGGGAAAVPPATGPTALVRLPTDAQGRPPAAPHRGARSGPASGRAPPTTTGT